MTGNLWLPLCDIELRNEAYKRSSAINALWNLVRPCSSVSSVVSTALLIVPNAYFLGKPLTSQFSSRSHLGESLNVMTATLSSSSSGELIITQPRRTCGWCSGGEVKRDQEGVEKLDT